MPVVGNRLELVSDRLLGKSSNSHSAVTGHNANYDAKQGNATWQGTSLKLSGEGLSNYWYVPDVPNEVSIGIVQSNGYGDAYVLSKNYGGCELHQLYHAKTKQFAFLHVYRTAGKAVKYKLGSGWKLQCKISSLGLADRFGGKAVWSISCIDRTTTPPTVSSQFIGVQGEIKHMGGAPGTASNSVASNPMVTITHVDDGLSPPA